MCHLFNEYDMYEILQQTKMEEVQSGLSQLIHRKLQNLMLEGRSSDFPDC